MKEEGYLNLESISTKIFKEGYLKLKEVQRRTILKVEGSWKKWIFKVEGSWKKRDI